MLDKSQDRIKEHLDAILANGVDFEISDVIKDGFQRFKKSASSFIFFILVLSIIYLVGASIPFGQVILSIGIIPAMMIGSMYFCFNDESDKRGEFSHFFKGFNDFKDFVPANVIIFILSTLVSLILVSDIKNLQDVISQGEPSIEDLRIAFESIPFVKLIIVCLGMIVVQFLTFYTNYFIGLYQLNTLDSLKYSALFALKKGVILLVFHLVLFCLLFSSIFLFIIGVFIVAAILVPIYYSSFLELTGYRDLIEESVEEIW